MCNVKKVHEAFRFVKKFLPESSGRIPYDGIPKEFPMENFRKFW